MMTRSSLPFRRDSRSAAARSRALPNFSAWIPIYLTWPPARVRRGTNRRRICRRFVHGLRSCRAARKMTCSLPSSPRRTARSRTSCFAASSMGTAEKRASGEKASAEARLRTRGMTRLPMHDFKTLDFIKGLVVRQKRQVVLNAERAIQKSFLAGSAQASRCFIQMNRTSR